MRAGSALALLLLGAGGGACGGGEPDGAARPRGIVLLLLDTVRADRTSAYDPQRTTTPALAALAARGAVFERAQASAPWTVPSVASLWTGLPPATHGAGLSGDGPRKVEADDIHAFDAALATLPRRLQALGFRTYGRIANPLVDDECFTDGFDEMLVERAPADELVAWVEERLGGLGREPFFFYLHFMDAHVPLEPPDELLREYLPPGLALDTLPAHVRNASRWSSFKKLDSLRSREFPVFRTVKEATYAASLRFLDGELARLFAAFERAGLGADTLFVVTADHGEEFWDHWEAERDAYDVGAKVAVGTGHGHTLFQELLQVPLVLAGPGVERGRRIAAQVGLVDLGSTLLELGGGGAAAPLGAGASFAPLLRGEAQLARLLWSENLSYGYELQSLVDADGFKLIRARHPGERDLLFDLRADPGETRDLAAAEPARAEALRRALDALLAEHTARHVQGERIEGLDLELLQDLGYAGEDGDVEDRDVEDGDAEDGAGER